MIINKNTKSILTRSDKPNENWTGDNNFVVVKDNSPLAIKILENYPNVNIIIENDEVIDVQITTPEIKQLTHDEINQMIVEKIRQKYDVNEEFKMINLGLNSPNDEKYIEYRNYVNECILWGDSIETGGDV